MRFGFACKYILPNGKQPYPARTVTAKALSALTLDQAQQKLIDIFDNNVSQLYRMIKLLSQCRPDMRMMRISSDLFPLFTHALWAPVIAELIGQYRPHLAAIGKLARDTGVRLSFHPGQYSVLASDRPEVVDNAIADLEYHTLIATMMGYGQKFQDFKINVHLSGKLGQKGFRNAHYRLSPACQLMLTLENDEVTSSLEQVLELADLCPIVLDVHHHWVMENQYIMPHDNRVKRVIASWRGVRPTMHYSISRPEHVPSQGFPDQNMLTVKKGLLRAHADYYHNEDVNEWALSFDQFDIMCESKAKNLARNRLLDITPFSAHLWSK